MGAIPVKTITGMEATQTVSTTVFNQETEERKHIEIRPFATTPAIVQVKLGRTVNLGNYESARVDVSIELPCYREEVLTVYPKLFKHVASIMDDEVAKMSGGRSVETSVEEML